VSSLANREPRIDVIVYLRDLSPSSSRQVVLKLHRKSVLGKVQHIEIGSAELVSQDTGGEQIKGEHFFTFGWTSKRADADPFLSMQNGKNYTMRRILPFILYLKYAARY